jgi:polysaccharide export outer membrane protein
LKRLTTISFSFIVSLFLAGCFAAPGMFFGAQPSGEEGEVDTLATFKGAQVHLQSIGPKSLVKVTQNEITSSLISPELLDYKPETYKLGKFDIVQVTVWEHPELTLPLGSYRSDNATGQMIDENGEMFYPYTGQIPVEGKTISELKNTIVDSLSKVLNTPQIDVRLITSQSQKAYVQGAVQKPGTISLSDVPVSLLEALNRAGGLTAMGNPKYIELVRDGKLYSIDLTVSYPAAKGPADVILKNGDVIRVPENSEFKVFVLGEVNKQQALPIRNGNMSLSEALSEVGGLQVMSAESKGIYVIRSNEANSINVYHLNSKNPLALIFGDAFKLQPRDIIFVDATGLARWNRLISQILPTVQTFYYGAMSIHHAKVAKDDIMGVD